jgi:hypothetical protein
VVWPVGQLETDIVRLVGFVMTNGEIAAPLSLLAMRVSLTMGRGLAGWCCFWLPEVTLVRVWVVTLRGDLGYLVAACGGAPRCLRPTLVRGLGNVFGGRRTPRRWTDVP